MSLKLGLSGQGNIPLGDVATNAKKSEATAPKSVPLFPVVKPIVPPTDYGELYVGPDPLIDNKNVKLLSENGISSFRPELLAVMNFMPAYLPLVAMSYTSKGGPGGVQSKVPASKLTTNPFDEFMTPVGKMLRVQLWSRELMKQDMLALVTALKTYDELEVPIAAREGQLVAAVKQAADDADFLFTLVTDIERLKNSFDLRRVLTKDSIVLPRLGGLSSKSPAGNDWSPAYVFTKYLGFDEANFTAFTNTKLFQQAVLDLRRIIARGSIRLFGTSNQSRKADADPTALNYAFDAQGSTFKFDVAALKSPAAGPTNASSLAYHKLFDESLPASMSDRAKLLATSVSRELRISIGLGDSSTLTSIAKTYPAVSDVGDPFGTILGSPGYSITDVTEGADQALVSVTRFTTPNQQSVLPFEETYINVATQGTVGSAASKGTLFIPGPSYYIDPIILGQPAQLDVGPLNALTSRTNRNTVAAVDAVGRLLQLPALVADPGKLFEPTLSTTQAGATLFLALQNQLFSMTPKDDSTKVKQVIVTGSPPENAANKSLTKELYSDPDQPGMFMGALIERARTNFSFRNELFRYFLLSGLVANIDGTRKGSFFEDLDASNELGLTTQNVKAALVASVEKLSNMLFGSTAGQVVSTQVGLGLNPAQKNTPPPKNDPYPEPQYLSFTADKSKVKWLLSSMATKATSLTPGFSYTWMNSLEETLRAYNDIENKRNAKLNGLTRRSSISLSTMALMVYESFISLMAGNVPAFFVSDTNAGNIRVVIDATKLNSMAHVVQVVRSKIESNPAVASNVTLSSFGFEQAKLVELQSIADAIVNEDNAVILIMQMLDFANDGIQVNAKTLLERFSKSSPDAARYKELQALAGKSGVVLDRQQALVARFLVSEIEERLGGQLTKKESTKPKSKIKPATASGQNKPPAKPEAPTAQLVASDAMFLNEDVVTPGMTNALFSMLREGQFKSFGQSTVRIAAVGIPAGFSDNLTRVVKTKNATPVDFAERQRDVVAINVYKKDEQYDGLVFKPKSFLFELTRFVSRTADPDIGEAEDFFTANQKLKHVDFSFELTNSYAPEGIGLDKLFSDPAYGFLTLDQKASMVRNHAVSVLLEMYVRLLTGMNLNEQAFVANAAELLQKRAASSSFMKEAATVHLSKVLGTPIILDQAVGGDPFLLDAQSLQQVDDFDQAQKLVDVPTASGGLKEKLTEDLRTFARLFASRSMLSDGQIERTRLIAPKLFERVFNVAFDANTFEIDIKSSDPDTVKALTQQGMIVTFGGAQGQPVPILVPRSTDSGHVTFEKYFVDVEVVGMASQTTGDSLTSTMPVSVAQPAVKVV